MEMYLCAVGLSGLVGMLVVVGVLCAAVALLVGVVVAPLGSVIACREDDEV